MVFSGLLGLGAGLELRQCTSGVLAGWFLAPTVSINMAIKHQMPHIKTSNMQESKHTMAIGCEAKNKAETRNAK